MVTKSLFPVSRANYLSGIGITATIVLLFMFLFVGSAPVSAHTTVEVENIAIDAGWGIEPPVVGIRNDFVFKITTPGETEGTGPLPYSPENFCTGAGNPRTRAILTSRW